MLANYHTHTKRCKHASGEDREYVEAAIESGLRILGFADHCPWIFPDGFVSGMRLAPSEVDGYFHSLESLKKEYEKDIKIYIGFEAEYCPELTETQDRFLSEYPLDYMIMGQHFLGVENHSVYTGWKTEEETVLKQYVDTVLEGVQTGKYLYVAHPDLINFVGSEDLYEAHMRRLCAGLKAADIPVEINLLGLADGRRYPSNRFLKLAKETGNRAILGIDAHSPEQLKNLEIRERGKNLAQSFGLELIDTDLL